MIKLITSFHYLFFILILASCGPSSENYVSSGEVKLEATNYKEAIADFTRALQIDDKNAKAYLRRGEAKEKLKLYSDAIKDWDAALRIDPNNENALVNQATAYNNLSDYTMAIPILTKALNLNPLNEQALEQLALGYYNIKDYERALNIELKLLDINPNNPRYYLNIAYDYHNMGNYTDAKKYYKLAEEGGYKISKVRDQLAKMAKSIAKKQRKQQARKLESCFWCGKKYPKFDGFSDCVFKSFCSRNCLSIAGKDC